MSSKEQGCRHDTEAPPEGAGAGGFPHRDDLSSIPYFPFLASAAIFLSQEAFFLGLSVSAFPISVSFTLKPAKPRIARSTSFEKSWRLRRHNYTCAATFHHFSPATHVH
jgi:hypothetical protein